MFITDKLPLTVTYYIQIVEYNLCELQIPTQVCASIFCKKKSTLFFVAFSVNFPRHLKPNNVAET